jgi:hypothetical protein
MKLFKSFCKKELISRRVILRNQKIGFSEKDLVIFKTCLLILKLSLITHDQRKKKAKIFFKHLEYQKAIKKRIQLIGNMLNISTKKENLEKFSVLREFKRFLLQSRQGKSCNKRTANHGQQRISTGVNIK